VWFWASESESCSLLYKVLLACYYLSCLWCWGLLLGPFFIFFFSHLLLYYCPSFGTNLWVFIWWLVVSLLSLSFSCYTVPLGILVAVFGTTLLKSHLLVWSFLVVGSLSVCGWLKPLVPSDALVLYFIVSALGSLLFLLSCSELIFSDILLQLALLLKLGLAPFQFWVYKVLFPLNIPSLCFFLGPLKFGLLWLLVNISQPTVLLYFASFILGIILLWLSSTITIVLYASGSCQLLFLVLLGPYVFVYYESTYLLALLGVSWFSSKLLSSFFAFLSLGALPPLTMFWAKVLALSSLPTIYAGLLLLSSLLRLWPYMRCSMVLNAQCSTSPLHSAILILYPMLTVSFLF